MTSRRRTHNDGSKSDDPALRRRRHLALTSKKTRRKTIIFHNEPFLLPDASVKPERTTPLTPISPILPYISPTCKTRFEFAKRARRPRRHENKAPGTGTQSLETAFCDKFDASRVDVTTVSGAYTTFPLFVRGDDCGFYALINKRRKLQSK